MDMSEGLMVADTKADHMELTPQCRRQKIRNPRVPPRIPCFNQWDEGRKGKHREGLLLWSGKVFEEQNSESGS